MPRVDASRHAPDEIDAYLAALPDDVRLCLERVRRIVREIAPESTERVSYGVPIFRLQVDLVGMSARAGRCSLHTMSPSLVRAMAEELKGVKVSGATIHFTTDSPLPTDLIAGIVRRRMAEIASSG